METRMVARAGIPARAWNDFVWQQEAGWFFHTGTWVDYALAYTPGSRDSSQGLVYGDSLVGVIPAVVDSYGAPVFGGQPIPAPVICEEMMMRQQPGGHRALRLAWRPGHEVEDAEPLPGFELRKTWTHVVDLWDGDEPAHWRRLRRSYRSIIHGVERTHDLVVVSQAEAALLMERARNLHAMAAGRETRSTETWRLQGEWLAAGYGMLALAMEKASGRMDGFAYVIRYKNWAYYASGASPKPNIQHALQWHVMRALRHDGATQYYELGHDTEPGDDAKAANIAFFKAGWGGTRWPVQMVVAA